MLTYKRGEGWSTARNAPSFVYTDYVNKPNQFFEKFFLNSSYDELREMDDNFKMKNDRYYVVAVPE